MKSHKLKTEVEFFQKVVSGDKPWELRIDDRGYEVGDQLILQEYNKETQELTGFETSRIITYILRNAPQFGLMDGYCIMSFITP